MDGRRQQQLTVRAIAAKTRAAEASTTASKLEVVKASPRIPGNPAIVLLFLVVIFPGSPVHARETDSAYCPDAHAKDGIGADYVVRFGQGGFRDGRASDGTVGGGQLALDVIPCRFPLGLTLSGEYYTRSANPTQSYEIPNLFALNVLYARAVSNLERLSYFVSAGIGRLEVPDRGGDVDGDLFNFEAGVHWKRFDRFGFYASFKYLYAQEGVIDFNEAIVLLGITYRFSR